MTKKRLGFKLLLLIPILAGCATAMKTSRTPSVDASQVTAAKALMARADLAAAAQFIDKDRETTIAQWRALTEIPSPSGQEAKRAAYVETLLQDYGLSDVHHDSAGNVMGTMKGTGPGSNVVFDAHMDTVFPMSTDVTTRMENGKIYAPGVGDDTRNMAALLAMIRAISTAKVQFNGNITFVFTTSEETDYRGALQFVADHKGTIDRYVTLDGGYTGFTYGGIGIYWYKYHLLGPGGHTRSDTPPYSAALPIARAIERIYRLKVPDNSYINIGMLGAGDVFNAKAADAWFGIDLRSNDEATLKRLDAKIAKIVQQEASREQMQVRREVVSTEEVATLAGHRTSPMVQTTEAVFRAFGFEPAITDTASNHTSVAIRAGIPAIGTGSGPCEGAHGLSENCDVDPLFTGIKRNVVLGVALADQTPDRK